MMHHNMCLTYKKIHSEGEGYMLKPEQVNRLIDLGVIRAEEVKGGRFIHM